MGVGYISGYGTHQLPPGEEKEKAPKYQPEDSAVGTGGGTPVGGPPADLHDNNPHDGDLDEITWNFRDTSVAPRDPTE